MESEKYLEGQSMQRPPLFESDGFIYWKNRFETYVKSKDLDLWHVITYGDFPPIQNNPETKKDEIVPFDKQNDDLKKKLAKNNEAKMAIYNALLLTSDLAMKVDKLTKQLESIMGWIQAQPSNQPKAQETPLNETYKFFVYDEEYEDDDIKSENVNKLIDLDNMDDPNITMDEYIRLEEEKARRRGKVFNWETTTYAIVFNDTITSEATLLCVPTVSSLDNDEIDFRISFDESDDEDYTVYGVSWGMDTA
ncbi:hypothetical protein Tco_1376968 [Tanacetum coccineum]